MKKKIAILAALSLFAGTAAYGQEARSVNAKITDAIVYYSGAELVHTASAVLDRGENEIVIKGLSSRIDLNSLRIKATNNVVVSSSEFSVDYLIDEKERLSATAKRIDDSLRIYRARLEKTNVDIVINNQMLDYLKTGTTKNISGSETGLGIDELVKTMDYYKAKSEELEGRRIALTDNRKELEKNINRLTAQYHQEALKGNKTAGTLRLRLSAPLAARTDFTITYFTAQAGWTPYYDINIESTDKPVKFVMKSRVRQATGMDWDKVRLSLSTAQPSNGHMAPIFSAWFLKQWTPSASSSSGLYGRSANITAQNSISYDDTQLDEVVVLGYGGASDRKSAEPAPAPEPMYVINGAVASKYDFDALDPGMIKSVSVLKEGDASSLYGARAAGGAVIVELKSMDDYVVASENELNVVYNIDLPYTIPGTGKEQVIELQTKTTTAGYKYYCAPKLDPQTYLLAEISGWEYLGLLSGNANVTYDGTYIGQTNIDASSTHEKLNLTLGADKRVVVKREVLKEYTATRAVGSDTQQTFAYRLTVRNNQTKPVRMILKDQYPLSAQKNIEVTLNVKQTTPWSMNREDLGVITWEEDFAAGETKEYVISYTVKYPKNMVIDF